MKKSLLTVVLSVSFGIFLTACGGGGGSSTPAATPTAVNLAAIYTNMLSNTSVATFNTTGLCTGSLSTVNTPISTTPVIISGTSVLASSQLMYGNFGVSDTSSICGPGHLGAAGTPFFTFYNPTTKLPVGDSNPSTISATALPTSATPGASGTFYTYTTSDSSGVVTWTLSSDGQVLTIVDANTYTASKLNNYSVTRTYAINSASNTSTPKGLTFTIYGSNGVLVGSVTGVASTASMPSANMQAGYQSFVQNGWSKNFRATGSCTGTLNMSQSPVSATPTTFQGLVSYPATFTQVASFSNSTGFCSSSGFGGTQTSTNYYNASQIQVADSVPSLFTAVTALPTSLSAGPTYGVQYTYTQPNISKSGTVFFAVAPPASEGGSPVFFSYETNASNSGTSFSYASLMVSLLTANGNATPVSFSFTDKDGDELIAY